MTMIHSMGLGHRFNKIFGVNKCEVEFYITTNLLSRYISLIMDKQ